MHAACLSTIHLIRQSRTVRFACGTEGNKAPYPEELDNHGGYEPTDPRTTTNAGAVKSASEYDRRRPATPSVGEIVAFK